LLLRLVFGERFEGYGAVTGILSLGIVAMSVGLVNGIGLWAIDRPKANLPADVCTFSVTLLVVALLLGPMGIMGVAIGDLSGKIVGAAVRHRTLRRLTTGVAILREA
jgi:O-antigen/teichoic acid export membrane protein